MNLTRLLRAVLKLKEQIHVNRYGTGYYGGGGLGLVIVIMLIMLLMGRI